MSMQRGRGAGITGLVDFAGSPKFFVKIYRWQRELDMQRRPRNGRGTGRWQKSRPMRPGGNLALSGKVRLDGWPMPSDWRGQEGTITVTLHKPDLNDPTKDIKETVAVRVISSSISLDEKEEDVWNVKLACEITALPTSSGFGGTQATADVPAGGRQEVYDGLGKTFDPDDLNSGAIQSIDVWMIADSDAAEMQAIAETIASAAVPVPNTKLRQVQFNRTDADGGYITVSYAKTTSAEDVINGATNVTIDPNDLTSSASAAAINVDPSAPSGSGTASLVPVRTVTRELNDNNILKVTDYATRDSKQAIEQDGTGSSDDPRDLSEEEQIAIVSTSATAPAIPTPTNTALKHKFTGKKQINNGHYVYTYFYGRTDSLDEIQMGGTVSQYDPNLLAGSAVVTRVSSSATPPATPANPIDGVKYVDYTVRQRHDTRWVFAFRYEPLDSAERITIPRTTGLATATTGVSNVLVDIVPGSSAYSEVVSAFNNNKANVYFRNARTVRLPNGQILREMEYEDLIIHVQFQSINRAYRTVAARMSGGVVQVFLLERIQVSSTHWAYRLGYQTIGSVEIIFSVSRKWSSSVLPIHTDLASTVNGAEFLGLPARTTSYIGDVGDTNIAIAPPRISANSWQFVYYSSGGFVKTDDLPVGQWMQTTTDLSAKTPWSWVAASDLGLSTVTQFSDGDYSVFTS